MSPAADVVCGPGNDETFWAWGRDVKTAHRNSDPSSRHMHVERWLVIAVMIAVMILTRLRCAPRRRVGEASPVRVGVDAPEDAV